MMVGIVGIGVGDVVVGQRGIVVVWVVVRGRGIGYCGFSTYISIGRLNIRSEEHTSELQSRLHIVCRLLREKKKTTTPTPTPHQHHDSIYYWY